MLTLIIITAERLLVQETLGPSRVYFIDFSHYSKVCPLSGHLWQLSQVVIASHTRPDSYLIGCEETQHQPYLWLLLWQQCKFREWPKSQMASCSTQGKT